MKEQKRNIDELFLEELGNATEVPPSSVWTTLETQLDGQGNTGATGNLGRFKTWWLVWSLVVLISGSVTGYMVLNKPKRDALRAIPGKELPAPVPERSNRGAADTSGNTIPGSDNDSNNTQEGYDQRQDIKHDRKGAGAGANGSREANKNIRSGISKQSHKNHTVKTAHTAVRGGGAATSSLSSNAATASGHIRGASGPAGRAIKTSGTINSRESSVNKTTEAVAPNPDAGTRGENDGNREQVSAADHNAASIASTGNRAGKDNNQSSARELSARDGKRNPGEHAVVSKTGNTTTGHTAVSNNSVSSSAGKKTNQLSGDPGRGTCGKNKSSGSSMQTTPVATSIIATGNRSGKGNGQSSGRGLSGRGGKDNPGEQAIVSKTGSSTAGHTAVSKRSVSSAAGKKTNQLSGDSGSGTRGKNIGDVPSVQKAAATTSIPAAADPAHHNAVANSKNTTARSAVQNLKEPAVSGARAVAAGPATMTRNRGAAKTNETKNGSHAAGEENTPVGKAIPDVVSAAKGSTGKPVLPIAATEKKQAPAVPTGQRESSKAAALPVVAKDNVLLIDTDKMNSEDDGTDEPYLPVVTAPKPAVSKMNVTEEQPGRPGVAPVSRTVATVVQQAAAQPAVTAPKLRSDVPDFLKVTQQDGAGGGGGDAASAKKTKKKGPRSSDFEGGVKLGYEVGAAAFTSGKFVASFYAQYNLDERLGLVIQPAIKIATTNRKLETPQGNYYSVTRPTDVVLYSIDSPIGGGGGKTRSFAYSQTYDSMIASVVSQQKYAEIDLPLMLRYQLSKNFSVMGGINITLGKIINLNSSVRTISGLTLRDTISGITDTIAPAPASKFDHRSSVPFSGYAAAEGLNAEHNPVRFGYTVSMSYVIRDRIMIDFLMQQTTSNLNYIPNREVRKLYSQPYMRFTVGYKLFGGRKQVRGK